MASRILACLVTATLLGAGAPVARAENAMGYRLLTPADAASLPRNHGALGLQVERAKQIIDAGLTFDVMRIQQVKRGSAGARAGLRAGDQIIAVDGRVFPTIATFAAYVGSIAPGGMISIDYMPSDGGPAQAQRVQATIGGPNVAASGGDQGGMSTGTKLAIGAGAVALFGCYELGCFSHHGAHPTPAPNGQPPQPPASNQQ